MKEATILYVEDDETLSFVTKDNLELNGYEVTHCSDGSTAYEVFQQQRFDLCVLDVMLPQTDGFMLAKQIRALNRDVPIIFLTAKSLKEDKIYGLRIGADDYMTKPFSIEELILKINVFLRRSRITGDVEVDVYQLGQYKFDYKNMELSIGDVKRQLTQREAELLKYFADNSNKVLKRSEILEQLWGEDDYFLGRSLDVFVSRLRKYLKEDEQLKISNIHGVGFKFRNNY